MKNNVKPIGFVGSGFLRSSVECFMSVPCLPLCKRSHCCPWSACLLRLSAFRRLLAHTQPLCSFLSWPCLFNPIASMASLLYLYTNGGHHNGLLKRLTWSKMTVWSICGLLLKNAAVQQGHTSQSLAVNLKRLGVSIRCPLRRTVWISLSLSLPPWAVCEN